jgi:predicted dehydrogenase
MKTYRVAILGCRGRGTAAGRAYHAHPRTEVVALCDLVQERLDTLGDEFGVAARFTDLDEMIVQTQPDIVAIPTGTEFHYPLCMRVLEHGVHIEVEKPMCVDLEGTTAVMAKAKEKGVRVAVHHQGRVGALMRAMHKAFTEGAIGELRYINSRGKAYYGGLGLMNIGTHQLNNMLKFTGHCRTVSAIGLTDNRPITPEDVVPSPLGMGTIAGEQITAALHFDNSVTATLIQHRFPTGTGPVMEVVGTEGRLLGTTCLLVKGNAWLLPQSHYIPDGKSDEWEPLEPTYPAHYDRSSPAALDDYWFVEEYVSALDEGRAHECSGAEGHHIMEIMMGIFESAAYGKPVDLPQKCREHPLLRWRREQGMGPPEPMPRDYSEWLAAEDRRLKRM